MPDCVNAPTFPAVVEVNFVLTSYTFDESEDEVTLMIAKRGVTTNPLSVNISAEDGTALGMSIAHKHTITYTHTCAPCTLLKIGTYSSTTMCQYWDNRLITE